MSVTYHAYLNVVPGDSPTPIIKVNQYDANFIIQFHLVAKRRGIIPAYPVPVKNDEDVSVYFPQNSSDVSVSVRGTKTDGNGYSATVTYTYSAENGPVVAVDGHEQMTASAGANVYEITFDADDPEARWSTANFILLVEPAALDATTITSDSYMMELNDLIAAVPAATAAAQRAEAAATQFQVDDTLTQSGKPADAFATGTRINAIRSRVPIFTDPDSDGNIKILYLVG